MAKINITLDLADDVFDEAAMQLIRNRARAAVREQETELIEAAVDRAVKAHAASIADAIKSRYGYNGTEEVRKIVRDKLIDQAGKLHIEIEELQKQFDVVAGAVQKTADSVISDMQARSAEIDTMIRSEIERKVSAFLSLTIMDALRQSGGGDNG